MAWIYLIVAGMFEMVWAVGMKSSDGFTKLWPSIWAVAVAGLNFYLLSLAVRNIPIGSAYPIFTGIGAISTATVGILFFSEPRELLRLFCILLVVIGTVGIYATSKL